MEQFKLGDQIVYIPKHASGTIDHKDAEFGFVSSQRGDVVFCRYWQKDLSDLRTVSCGERTPVQMIVRYQSVSIEQVDRAIKRYITCKGKEA